MENWMRKNPFICLLRETLRHFRIEGMNIKMAAEMRSPYAGEPGGEHLPVLKDFKYTGREIVTITLYGWRRPRNAYPGIIETLTPPASTAAAQEPEHESDSLLVSAPRNNSKQ